jgi:hypothetical protein
MIDYVFLVCVAVVAKMTTFDLGVQGKICDILRPQLVMSRFLPLWPHRCPHFVYIHLGGGGVALILDRCRAFDLFASVDAHLWTVWTYVPFLLVWLLVSPRSDLMKKSRGPSPPPLLKWGQGASEDTGINRYRGPPD